MPGGLTATHLSLLEGAHLPVDALQFIQRQVVEHAVAVGQLMHRAAVQTDHAAGGFMSDGLRRVDEHDFPARPVDVNAGVFADGLADAHADDDPVSCGDAGVPVFRGDYPADGDETMLPVHLPVDRAVAPVIPAVEGHVPFLAFPPGHASGVSALLFDGFPSWTAAHHSVFSMRSQVAITRSGMAASHGMSFLASLFDRLSTVSPMGSSSMWSGSAYFIRRDRTRLNR